MLNKIKFLLNSISTREFNLMIIIIIALFAVKTYDELVPKLIQYESNKKTLLSQKSLLNKYQSLLKQQNSKEDLLNQKQTILNQGKALSSTELNTSKYFNSFKSLHLWICKIENKYIINKATIQHTDIKGLIKVDIFATIAKLKPRKCFTKENINLANVFYTKKLTVFSIIGNKVKINNLWYAKGDNISKHIIIIDIKSSFIAISYNNKLKKVLLGGSI